MESTRLFGRNAGHKLERLRKASASEATGTWLAERELSGWAETSRKIAAEGRPASSIEHYPINPFHGYERRGR